MAGESPAARTEQWPATARARIRTAADAIRVVEPGHRVFVGSGAAVPRTLLLALAERAPELRDTELLHLLTLGLDPTTGGCFLSSGVPACPP